MPTATELEGLKQTAEMASFHALSGPHDNRLARHRELERLGRMPAFRSISIEPGFDHNDTNAEDASMAEFRYESLDRHVEHQATRADEEARYDADANFWRIDTWTQEQLADNARFGYYAANVARRDSGKVAP